LGIIVGYLSKSGVLPFNLLVLGDKYTLAFSLFGNFKPMIVPGLFSTGLTVAVVAIIETMISAKIADGMTGTKHAPRKEMLGLSLANIASGITGGMPATAALARTSLNIKSGATSRVSSISNGVIVLAVSFFLFSYFRFLPLAVIAAILVYTAVRMVEVDHLKNLYRFSKQDFYLTLLVALICIIEDSIVGLLAGAVIGLLIFVYKQSQGEHRVVINVKTKGKQLEAKAYNSYKQAIAKKLRGESVAVYTFKGALVYINGQEHKTAIEELAKTYKTIILRFRKVSVIDLDGVEVLDEIIHDLEEDGVKVYLCSINSTVKSMFGGSKLYLKLKEEGKVFEKTAPALESLGFKV
jgi:SulP family sulfate permease